MLGANCLKWVSGATARGLFTIASLLTTPPTLTSSLIIMPPNYLKPTTTSSKLNLTILPRARMFSCDSASHAMTSALSNCIPSAHPPIHCSTIHNGAIQPFHFVASAVPRPPLPLPLPSDSVPRVIPSIERSSSNRTMLLSDPALAELFASCSLPHHLIELPQLIATLNAYRSSDIALPSRATLRQDILSLAQQLRVAVVRRLKGYCRSYPLTVAIDGWTNVRQDKVTNVLILCGGMAFYWCSIVNVSSRNTAVWMHDPMRKVLEEIKQEGLIFSALVADNEQVNKTLHHLLLPSFPFLIRSPCAAHLVQLCVNHALNLPAIEPSSRYGGVAAVVPLQ